MRNSRNKFDGCITATAHVCANRATLDGFSGRGNQTFAFWQMSANGHAGIVVSPNAALAHPEVDEARHRQGLASTIVDFGKAWCQSPSAARPCFLGDAPPVDIERVSGYITVTLAG